MNELTDRELLSIWWITYGYEPINWHTIDRSPKWFNAKEKKGYIEKCGTREGYLHYQLTEKVQEVLSGLK